MTEDEIIAGFSEEEKKTLKETAMRISGYGGLSYEDALVMLVSTLIGYGIGYQKGED